MITRFALAITIAGGGASQSNAQEDLARMIRAGELGSVLASEEICGLSYKQAAIEAWIDKNVPADDIMFASSLDTAVMGGKFGYRDQTTSERTAHCAAIKKTAKHYGFID
ncbi:hypothetical protein pthi1_p38 [Paracoccus phage vB_PthS_Pthi1]|nr:signal recognition particle [Paracoccus thiocyanatus]AZV00403.1 hypothetical protein pthi1_p38 [Paracoccus phage vB_PthS_Pthi1]